MTTQREAYDRMGRAVYSYMRRWQAPAAARVLGADATARNAAEAVRGYYRRAREAWQAGDRAAAVQAMSRAADGVGALQRYAERSSAGTLAEYASASALRDGARLVRDVASEVRRHLREGVDNLGRIGSGFGAGLGLVLLLGVAAMSGGRR